MCSPGILTVSSRAGEDAPLLGRPTFYFQHTSEENGKEKKKKKVKKSHPLLEIKINQLFLLENIAAKLNFIKCYPNPHHFMIRV